MLAGRLQAQAAERGERAGSSFLPVCPVPAGHVLVGPRGVSPGRWSSVLGSGAQRPQRALSQEWASAQPLPSWPASGRRERSGILAAPSHGLLPEPFGVMRVCAGSPSRALCLLFIYWQHFLWEPRAPDWSQVQHLDHDRLWVSHEMSCFVARAPAPLMCQTLCAHVPISPTPAPLPSMEVLS